MQTKVKYGPSMRKTVSPLRFFTEKRGQKFHSWSIRPMFSPVANDTSNDCKQHGKQTHEQANGRSKRITSFWSESNNFSSYGRIGPRHKRVQQSVSSEAKKIWYFTTLLFNIHVFQLKEWTFIGNNRLLYLLKISHVLVRCISNQQFKIAIREWRCRFFKSNSWFHDVQLVGCGQFLKTLRIIWHCGWSRSIYSIDDWKKIIQFDPKDD